MADNLRQPHDKLFRSVFSETAEAAGLLRAALPDTIREQLDWPTLTLLGGSFLDDNLRESESDLLFQVERAATRQPVRLYILFEHQSSPDKWMRFRLLKYCCRIWDASFRETPDQTQLPLVLPVVFYQGVRGWSYSTELADLFPEAVRSWSWTPRFEHVLLDQTGIEPEAVAGGLKGRVAQLLLMASASSGRKQVALQLAAALSSALYARDGRGALRQFIEYLTATQDEAEVELFKETAQRVEHAIGDEIMTYAEQLLAEGRAEGEAKGRAKGAVEMVEGLLRVGVRWEVIEAATGLDESRFRALKEEVASRP